MRYLVLLTFLIHMTTLGSAAGQAADGDSEEAADGVSRVEKGDHSLPLWRPTGEVRRLAVMPLRGDLTESQVSGEEVVALAKRRLNRQGGIRKHGESWMRYEVELDPATVKPLSPASPLPLAGAARSATEASAPGDFVLHVDTVVSSGFGEVPEPTAVAVGDYVFYTANHFYGKSTDGGASFDLFSPFAGPFAPPGAEFCCDQTSVYDPTTDTIFFLQQYLAAATTGVQRINIDQGADGSFECAYDLTPQSSGFPTNRWADYPDLAISAGHLFHSSNVFDTQSSGSSVGAFVNRYPLSVLAACDSLVGDAFIDTNFSGFRFTRGAGATMYFASHISNDAMRIWSWPDDSSDPTFVDRAVTGWMTGPKTCIGPEGREYCEGLDNRLQSGWVADGVVGFMWNPTQGGDFPFPYTRVEKFSTSGLILVEEIDVHSALSAMVYPSVAVNDNEDLGGAIMIGGGDFPVTGMVWIADDYNGDSLEPIELEVASVSGYGPLGGRIGDYTMARPYYPDSSQWVAATFGYLGDPAGGPTVQFPGFHRFGREEAVEPLIFSDGFESGDLSAWN